LPDLAWMAFMRLSTSVLKTMGELSESLQLEEFRVSSNAAASPYRWPRVTGEPSSSLMDGLRLDTPEMLLRASLTCGMLLVRSTGVEYEAAVCVTAEGGYVTGTCCTAYGFTEILSKPYELVLKGMKF
jgi:hypothetical protein